MTALTLLNIPVEILLDICRRVPVNDAVHLFRTCKVLHGLSKLRQFWVDRLRALLNRYCVPSLCFDVSRMSTDELRMAVSRPYRFQRAIDKQLLANRTPVHLKLQIKTQDAVLIPGGRWLVVTARPDPTWPWPTVGGVATRPPEPVTSLQIYDIRPPTAKNLSLVASVQLQQFPTHVYIQPATTEADGVALIFVNYDNTSPQLLAEIYSFHPFADEGTRLRSIHSLKFERGSYTRTVPHAVTMGDNLIWAFSSAHFLVVNWRSREWAFLHAVTPTLNDLELISINPNCNNPWMTCLQPGFRHILAFERPQMKPWPVPALDSVSAEQLNVLDQCPADPETFNTRFLYTYGKRLLFKTWGEPRTTFWQDESLRKSFIFTAEQRICCIDSLGFPDDGNELARTKRYYEPERAIRTVSPIVSPARITSETVGGRKLALLREGRIVSCSGNSGEGRYAYYQMFGKLNLGRIMASLTNPFICPLSGVIGAIGSNGDLVLWREK